MSKTKQTATEPESSCQAYTPVKVSMSEVINRANAINLEKLLAHADIKAECGTPPADYPHIIVRDCQRERACQVSTVSSGKDRELRMTWSCERRRPHAITLTDLQAAYHLPISGAARKFDIGLTLLKKRCRELGLKRWPYRKLKSMDKLLQSIESVDGDDPQVATAVDEIKTHKQMMVLAPSETEIEVGIKKFRQAAYKFEFKSKRASMVS